MAFSESSRVYRENLPLLNLSSKPTLALPRNNKTPKFEKPTSFVYTVTNPFDNP
tara:strand:+ start:2125 stop:2286 length:162 start_codon:yes stop_codon:yes gene_type:complete